jgi:hypothetical protein
MSDESQQGETKLVTYRTMDVAVALFFLLASAVVIADSVRVGFQWRPSEGPAPGYFPFYIALLMAGASLVNLVRALPSPPGGDSVMITRQGFGRMSAIFLPAVVFVFAAGWIGIYVSAAVYIAAFMMIVGRFPWWKAAAVSLGIAVVSFLMFEVWFLTPLPKGPLEAALGY